ncbi:transmembrane protein, putative (macronuclear) [Tetrahymena thermophila SB210]|uniref:Transmembrane protein, putative n=1 Tax=Tetrahymena thermophila (strain SB210) TaxID=312017 RepID=Q248B2_TETTS|nr:transmembrane protein, putative [Tetrahymena thermophila SB210]EAS04133.2 transmembrane protein, putative [Tetrahymena thermophila SB210]|eukprot:XP_001024378.2 transmembrane protein, putative [Tetrahymena thermophila SB210]
MEADQFIKCQHNNIRMSLKHQSGNSKQKIEMHKDLPEKKSIKEKLVDFYFTEFDSITKRYKRGKLVSFLIFSLFQLQQISLLYNKQVQDLINSSSSQNIPQQFFSILSYSRIDPLINDLINLNSVQANVNVAHLSKYITLICFLLFSLLFLIHMTIRLIFYLIYNEHQTVESHLRVLHQNSNGQTQNQNETNSLSTYRIKQNITFLFDNIASVYYQLVLFVFYIPSVQIFSEIYNDKLMGYGFALACLSFFNLVIQLLIVFIYILHDYDYEIQFQDHLSKRDSLWSFYHLFAKGVMATFYNTSWGLGISTIHWVLKLIEVIEIFFEFPYHDELIRKWNCLYLICHFTFSFVAYLYIFLKLRYSCNISIIYLVAIPIAMLFGELIYVGMQNRIKHVYKNSKNPAHVDLYIRYLNKLFDMEYNKYTQLKYGVDFESLYTNHITSCNDLRCFCSDFQYKPFKWENFIQSDDRSLFLQGYIVNLFERQASFIQNKKDSQTNKLRFTYLQFLIENIHNPTKAFTQIISSLCENNIFSIKEQYVLHIIMRRCLNSYRQFFVDSIYQNQRLPMLTVISFDYILESSFNLFKEILYSVREFYNFLSQDLINLEVANSISQRIITKRYILEQNIRLLFDINPRNDSLYGLTEGFSTFLDFKNRRISYYKKRSLDLLNKTNIKQDIQISLTYANSCIIYISLLQQGVIQKLTQSAEYIFGIQKNNLVGKSIDNLMPDIYSQNHAKYLQKFVDKGSMENLNVQRSQLFGKSAQGFIFPIQLRIRLNYIGNEDFGVCGQITRIRDMYSEFILFDKDLNISDISKKLYKIAFQQVFEDDKKKMKKINLVRMIPLIGALIDQNHQDQDKYIESALMVIPQSQKQITFFRRRESSNKEVIQKYLKELNYTKYAFFEISLQYSAFKSSYGNIYRALEIKKIRKIKSQESKFLLITDFVESYNKQFFSSITYEQNDNLNSSSRYFDNNTFAEQSQLIASTISFKTSKQQSKQNRDQQSGYNADLFSTQKSRKRQINGDLFNQKLGLQKIIRVELLVNRFIHNLKREVFKKRNQTFQQMLQQNQKQSSNSQLQQKSQFMRESLNKTPLLFSTNSKILSDSNILKKDTDQSNNFNKKNNQQPRTLQHIDNIYNLSIDGGGGEKEECVISINYLGDNISQRGTELMIQNQQQDSIQKVNINSPLYADRPILQFQNNSNIPLSLWNSGVNEFSVRQEYQQYLENNLNLMDYEVDTLQDQKNKAAKESRLSNYIQNNEDFASPSTKDPSSVNQQLTNKKSLQYFASISFKSPKSEEPQENAVLEEPAQLFTPHLKSDNQLISRMPEQKFYDQVGTWEYNKVYSSQLDSLSPVKRKQSNFKHRNTIQLQNKQQNDALNGNFNKIKSLLIDEFEQQIESEDEENNKTRNKNNTQTIYDFEIKMKKKIINDQNSVKSALSQQKSKKFQIINKITTRAKPILIFSIELIGIVSFFFMLTVTTGIFIYLNTIFQQNVQNFQNLLTGPYLSSDYASLMKEYNSKNLYDTNQFPYLSSSQTQIKDTQQKLLQSFRNGVKNLFDYRSDASYSDYVNTQQITVDYYLIFDNGNPDTYSFKQNPMQFLINYSTLILQTQIYYIVQNTIFKNSIRYSEKNFIQYFKEFQTIQTMANDQSISKVNTMQQNIITTIAIMEVVAFFILIIAIPIYYKIQNSRENWMKLFATQSQDKLQEMINRIDLYLVNQYGTLKQLEKANFKRKTVSSIVGLKKYNMKLILFITTCLILVSIYPIINLIYTQNFKNEFDYQISEIEIIVKTRAQFNTEFALVLIIANSLYSKQTIDQDTFNFYQQIHQNNTQIINQLYYLSEQFTGNRFNKNIYQDLLIDSLNKNVCSSIEKYPQYYPSNTTIDIIQCQSIYNSIFTEGMITTLKNINGQFESFLEIAQSSNQSYQQQFQSWVIQADLNSLLILQRQLSDYLEILQIFLINMTTQYRDYILNIQFWLYFYSLIIIIAIFLIGFNIFVRKLTTSLYKTRNLLTLFKVDYIIDNSYMMTFLSDQIQKGKVV